MKKMFLFGFALLIIAACQQTEKRSGPPSSKKDTNVILVKKARTKKKLPEKIDIIISHSQKTEYSVDSFFEDISILYKESVINDSTTAEDGVEKYFVIDKNSTDSITQTLFVKTKVDDQDSVKKDCYFIWYSYQNTMNPVDTAQDISLLLFKDSLGKVRYAQIDFDQYLLADSLKDSKTAIVPHSSFELRDSELKKMFVLLKKK